MTKSFQYDSELNELRADNMEQKVLDNFKSITKSIRKVESINNDVDKRIEACDAEVLRLNGVIADLVARIEILETP